MAKLKRALTLPLLTFYGVGMILGAGIYTIIGRAVGISGDSVWLSLILAAFVALLAGLSYAQLASMYPQIGGEYLYLKKALPNNKWIANTCGLLIVFSGITTASVVSLAFAGYLQNFLDYHPTLIATFLLMFFTAINVLGIKESSWMNVLFTLIEAAGLLIFIYWGVKSPDFGKALFSTPSFNTISASSLIIFAYFGFESLVNFSEEAINPRQSIPKAILISLLISTFLYVLVGLAAVSLVAPEVLAKSSAPLVDALRSYSDQAASILAGIALFSTANTVLISLISTSRLLLRLSRDQIVPRIFSMVSVKRKTPWSASISCFILACFFLSINDIELLASLSAFSTMTAFLATHWSLISLRKSTMSNKKTDLLDFIKISQILPWLGILSTLLLLIQFNFQVYVVAGVILLGILLLQWCIQRRAI